MSNPRLSPTTTTDVGGPSGSSALSVHSGDMVASSRSASPASIRSIDIDEDTVFDDTAEGSTAPPRRSSTSAFQSVTNNGRGHTKRQSTSTRNAQKSAQGNGLGEHDAGGMVVEGVNLTGGSVLDRLLDLDYPRDFGDPVSRYQAALAVSAGNASTASNQQMSVQGSSSSTANRTTQGQPMEH